MEAQTMARHSREWMHPARDGTRLFVREFEPGPGPGAARGSILLTHGMGEHSGRYAHVVAAAERGGAARGDLGPAGAWALGGAPGGYPRLTGALMDDLRRGLVARAAGAGADLPVRPQPWRADHAQLCRAASAGCGGADHYLALAAAGLCAAALEALAGLDRGPSLALLHAGYGR